MKKFLFVTDVSADDGYRVIEGTSAKEAGKQLEDEGFPPIVYQNGAEVKEDYKGQWIIDGDGCIMVFHPGHNTKFIVNMDDSKRTGERTFDESLNTVEAARAYIDVTAPKEKSLKFKVWFTIEEMYLDEQGIEQHRNVEVGMPVKFGEFDTLEDAERACEAMEGYLTSYDIPTTPDEWQKATIGEAVEIGALEADEVGSDWDAVFLFDYREAVAPIWIANLSSGFFYTDCIGTVLGGCVGSFEECAKFIKTHL